MTPSAPPEHEEKTELPRPLGAGRSYLIVVGEASRMFELPAMGAVVIGRGGDVEIRVDARAVSRRHATIVIGTGEAVVTDLESSNGTFVNGERLTQPRTLQANDVITLGNVSLVYHCAERATAAHEVLASEAFRRRLEEEVDRSLRHQRSLLVVALMPGQPAGLASLASELKRQLALGDILARSEWGGFLVLIPEILPGDATAVFARLRQSALAALPGTRAGYALYPADGLDAGALLDRATESARADGHEGRASESIVQVGDRSVVVVDTAMVRMYDLIRKLASSTLSVLICGETGAGKEIAAAALHHWSERRHRRLLSINCAAVPETLMESELFGHERGAFSSASATKIGLLEAADGGTVVLDEIGELAPAAQAKLLRVLETRMITRIGDVREREIDIRVVASTNRNLSVDAREGRFRRDLFFRLSGGMLWVPPLRDRKVEIPILAGILLAEACARAHRPALRLSSGAMDLLTAYSWPGNVRELRNLLEYLAATVSADVIEDMDLRESLGMTVADSRETSMPAPADAVTGVFTLPTDRRFRPIDEEIRELERERMLEALRAAGGNQTRAAQLIGMPLRTFISKRKLYDLSRTQEIAPPPRGRGKS